MTNPKASHGNRLPNLALRFALLVSVPALVVGVFRFDARGADQTVPAPVGIANWWQGEGSLRDFQSTNHGSLQGAMLFTQGKVGECFSFNGIDGSVWFPSPTVTNINQFSFIAWVKWSGLTGIRGTRVQTIFHIGTTRTGAGLIIPEFEETFHNPQLSASVGKVVIHFSGNRYIETGFSLVRNEWQHVALTREGSTTRLYWNDAKVFEDVGSGPFEEAAYSARLSDIKGTSFFGSIDEAATFNRPLSNDELARIWAAQAAGMTRVPYVDAIAKVASQRFRVAIKAPTGKPVLLWDRSDLSEAWQPVVVVPNPSGRVTVDLLQNPSAHHGFFRASLD